MLKRRPNFKSDVDMLITEADTLLSCEKDDKFLRKVIAVKPTTGFACGSRYGP